MALNTFWTMARDEQLIALAGVGADVADLAQALSSPGLHVSQPDIRDRMVALGIRRRRDCFWTPERCVKLRALWEQEPKLTVETICDRLEAANFQAVSRRARKLGLSPRYNTASMRSASEKALSSATAIPGESAVPSAELPPLHAPCPFYLGAGDVCGVMVNRRPDQHGNKPSQYCAGHQHAVLPVSKGALGHIRSAVKRGQSRRRYG